MNKAYESKEHLMDLDHLREMDRQHFLHPFTNHQELKSLGTSVIRSARGVFVTDETGRVLLDGLAGLWCVNVGYGRHEIVDAVRDQMEQVAYYPSFFNTTTEPAIRLAAKVVGLAGQGMSHVFFSNSGSEANETALKLLRCYQKIKGNSSRFKILTLSYAYHGVTLATTSMTGLASCRDPFDLPLPGFIQVPGPYHYAAATDLEPEAYGKFCIDETECIIKREGASTIAALFIEPIQGAGGVIVPPAGYLLGMRELCRKHGILFVADEVITGFGRVGAWFLSAQWNLEPDLIITAKGITSGYLPLGATLVHEPIADVLVNGGYLAHGFTYSGHPTSCAAALANIQILENERLITRTAEVTGPYFQNKLRHLAGHPAVGDVRGEGLIGALELVPAGGRANLSPASPLGPKIVKLARGEGVIVRGIRDILAIAPPLVITLEQIDQLFDAIERALNKLWT